MHACSGPHMKTSTRCLAQKDIEKYFLWCETQEERWWMLRNISDGGNVVACPGILTLLLFSPRPHAVSWNALELTWPEVNSLLKVEQSPKALFGNQKKVIAPCYGLNVRHSPEVHVFKYLVFSLWCDLGVYKTGLALSRLLGIISLWRLYPLQAVVCCLLLSLCQRRNLDHTYFLP